MSDAVIELLGTLGLRRTDQSVTDLPRGKIGGILTYLCCARPRASRRDALVAALWPAEEASVARRALRVHLSRLRSALGEDARLLRTEGERLTLEIASDVERFSLLLERARLCTSVQERQQTLEMALSLYHGPLAPGLDELWVVAERQRMADAYQSALGDMVRLLCQSGRLEDGLSYARRAVAADPFREEGQARLLQLYRDLGRPADARSHWTDVDRLFRAELGTPPPSTLRALVTPLTPPRVAQTASKAPFSPDLLDSSNLPACRSDVPHTADRLIGRRDEIAATVALLHGARLVTLTGPGGVGKTRLAREVAHYLAQQGNFANLCWVPLAEVGESQDVGRRLAERVERLLPASNRRDADRDPCERIVQQLAGHRTLLILDNLEHLSGDTVQTLLRELLDRLPLLALLATSRARLHLTGEQVYPVAPLTVPPQDMAPHALTEYSSVQLFLDRARQADARFQVTGRHTEAVAGLCRALDGLPLALEIAATQTRMMSAAEILSQVQKGTDKLTHSHADVPARHHSLEATLQWSYELLSPGARQALLFVSLVRGWFRREVAQALFGSSDTHTLLAELTDGSLLRTETDAQGQVRFFLLETTRAFASARIGGTERAGCCDRLTAYLSEYLHAQRHQVQQAFLDEATCALYANISALLEWHCEQGNVDAAFRLARSARVLWLFLGYRSEGARWIRRVLALGRAAGKADEDTVALIGMLIHVAPHRADFRQEVHTICDQVRPHLREARSRGLLERALGSLEMVAGSDSAARVHFQREIECGEHGATNLPVAWCNLASACMSEGDWDEARSSLTSARQANRERLPWIEGMILCLSADCDTQQGRLIEAKVQLDRAFALFRSVENPEFHLRVRLRLLRWLTASQKWDEASALLAQIRPLICEHEEGQLLVSEAFIAISLAKGDGESALRLLGAQERYYSELERVPSTYLRQLLDEDTRRASLLCDSEDAARRAWSAGQGKTLEEAVSDAYSALPTEITVPDL